MKPSQVVGGVLGALTAAALLIGLHKPSGPPPRPPPEEAELAKEEAPTGAQLKLRLAQASRACEAYADPDKVGEWDKAIEQCKAAIGLDPYQGRALAANTLSIKERDNKARFDAGQAHAQVGSRVDALDALASIPRESLYFKPAQVLFQKVAQDVLRTEHVRCTSAEPMEPPVRWTHCEAHARVACHLGWGPDAQAAFEQCRPAHPEWRCPEAYGPMLGIEPVRESDTALTKAIHHRYLDADIAALALDHARSDTDTLKRLGQVHEAFATPEKSALEKTLRDAIAAFGQAHGRFTAAMNRKDMDAAQAAWEAAMKLDGEIMPQGMQSVSAHTMTFDLASRYTMLSSQSAHRLDIYDSLLDCHHAEQVMPSLPAIVECKETLTDVRFQDALCQALRRERATARKGSPHQADVQGWLKDHKCGP